MTVMTEHPSVEDRKARGFAAGDQVPLSSHAGWRPAEDRPDPVRLLEEQNLNREQDLVPVRHGRMSVSPFTFYRGGARIMAADLNDTPVAGLTAQLCGETHLSNFGLFASPERHMAVIFTIAARNNGSAAADARSVTATAVRAYREAMAEFARMRTMDIWYAHLDEDELRSLISSARDQLKPGKEAKKQPKGAKKQPKAAKKAAKEEARLAGQAQRRAAKNAEKAHTRDSLQALSKLGELVDGRYRIVSQPPVIIPSRDLAASFGLSPDEVVPVIREQFRAYRGTLQPDRRHLLEQFEIVDAARKVVGVGSVGTRAYIVLLQG